MTSVAWLIAALNAGLSDAVAARVVVRLPWPITAAQEIALLRARLSVPSLRLAVEITENSVETIFHYMNRLGHTWLAVPGPGNGYADYASAVSRAGRLWLFDPRARTPMEPVIHALVTLVAGRSISARPTWRYRLVSARGEVCPITHVWTPSVHTILRAGGTIEDPRSLARADTAWINDLAILYERAAPDIPGLVAAAPRLIEERR